MQKPQTFAALNGLRFLAALAVVFYHYATAVNGYERIPGVIKNLVSEGPAAVGFFFILSGFVLAYRHLRRGSRAETAAAFYWARFVRLYPAYLIAFLLFLPLAVQKYVLNPSSGPAGRHTFVMSAVLSVLMLQSWTTLAQAWNGPSWSLSVEVFMYLLFPVIGARLLRLSRRSTAVILMAAWLIPTSIALAHVAHWIPDPFWRGWVTNSPLLWLPLFVIGICATRMLAPWATVEKAKANLISVSAFLALVVAALCWPRGWSDIFITGGVAPLMVAVIVFFTRISGWLTRIIGGKFLNRMGEASYVLYILQAPLWHYWQGVTNHLRGVPAQTAGVALWQFVVFVPGLVLASLAVQDFIEIPVRDWLTFKKNARDASKSSTGTPNLNLQAAPFLEG